MSKGKRGKRRRKNRPRTRPAKKRRAPAAEATPSPLTPEEAQRAYDEAPEVPLGEDRIKEIVDYATGRRGEE